MTSQRPVALLGTITSKIGTGATPKGGEAVYLSRRERCALIRSQNVFDRRFDFSGLAFIGEDHAWELRSAEVQAGDVLLNITGDGVTFGRACIVPPDVLPACVNQHVAIIRPDRNVCSPGFLLAYLTLPATKKYIESFNSGGSRRAITKGHIEAFQVPLPPLPEQRRIARILGALDDKIELNRRTNETLEAMARALFRAWFVDFEPVRAKQDGRPLDPLSQKYIHLFPDRLVDTEHGEIPEGWEWGVLGDLFDVNPPRRIPKGSVAPYLDMSNMPTRGHCADEWISREVGSGAKFQNGDTLLARITPCLENGKTAFVDFLAEGEVGWGSTEYIVLRPKPPLPPYFGYLLAREPEFRDFAIQTMNGSSGRQRVPAESLKPWRLSVPTEEVWEAFGQIVEPLARMIRSNALEAKTLGKTRDALLPRLLSGEVVPTKSQED